MTRNIPKNVVSSVDGGVNCNQHTIAFSEMGTSPSSSYPTLFFLKVFISTCHNDLIWILLLSVYPAIM